MSTASNIDHTTFSKRIKYLWKRKFDFKFWWYRFKWHYFYKWRIVPKAPLHVDIEVTDACNLRCKMCVHGLEGVPDVGMIEDTMAYRAIDQCAELGVYSIKFNFRGEPLLHKHLVDYVKYAKDKGILEVQFNTNFLTCDSAMSEAFIKAGLDRVIISVDGATKETYESIRVGSNFEKILENIENLIRLKKEHNTKKPFIRVQMVKFQSAKKETETFIRDWTEKGVDQISLIDHQDRTDQSGRPLKDGKLPTGRNFCEQPWQRLNINRDGKVLMCCSDWEQRSLVGDFNKQSISEIWHGKAFNAFRDIIDKKDQDKIASCKTCFRVKTYRWDDNGEEVPSTEMKEEDPDKRELITINSDD